MVINQEDQIKTNNHESGIGSHPNHTDRFGFGTSVGGAPYRYSGTTGDASTAKSPLFNF